MRLIDADKFLAEEFEAYIAVQADINADQGGLMEAKKLVNEIVHRKLTQLVRDADTVQVDTDRPKAHWDGGRYSVLCSECGHWSMERTNYCANCGAKMEATNEQRP